MWRALRAIAVAGVLVGVLGGAQGAALAQPAKPGPPSRAAMDKAKEHFQAGQRLFTVSRYREALEQFKNAFVAVEDPVFLFNIAQCHRLLGESAEAARFYRRYVEAAPHAPERARAEKWIAELEAAAPAAPIPAPVPAPAPAPTTVPPPPSSTTPPLVGPPPGVEPPAVTGDGAPTIDLSAPPPAEPGRPIYKRWWFWAGIGAVVVAGSVAAVAASNRGVTCPGGIQRCEQL